LFLEQKENCTLECARRLALSNVAELIQVLEVLSFLP
jgi:hypothetical protein